MFKNCPLPQAAEAVLKTFQIAPNSLFKLSKERVWSDLKCLKNRFLRRWNTFACPQSLIESRFPSSKNSICFR